MLLIATFHRTREGGIRTHKFHAKFQSNQSKFKNISKWKDEDDDAIMKNQTEGTSSSLQDRLQPGRDARDQFRPRPHQRQLVNLIFDSSIIFKLDFNQINLVDLEFRDDFRT